MLFNQIIEQFYSKGKYKFYFLFLFSLLAGLFEYMGLILIFQFVLFLSNPNTQYCKGIVDFFENNLNIQSYPKITLILGIFIAFVYVLKNIYMLIFTRFNNELLQELSVKITIKTMQNFLFQDFLKVDKISNEEKMNILSKNEFVVWHYCYKYINLITNCAIASILILYLFIKFTLPAVVAVIFISVLSYVEYKYLKKNSTYQNKHFSSCFDELNSILLKTVGLNKEIRLNNKQELFIEKIKSKCIDYALLNNNRAFCSIFHIYFTEISVMLAFVLVLSVLFYTTNFDNQLLVTSISTICVIILRLTPVINRAQSCLYSINSNRALVKELLDFESQFEKNISFEVSNEILPFENSIELQNVGFSYKKDDKGLKNINLKINKGEFIGIVGKSGCYKTTLSLLLSGLILPDEGKILIDGKTIKKENMNKWQNNVALLTQDYGFLFENTKDIDERFIKKLNLDNINSDINEMSFGEKQRVALASLLSNLKNVLILDEVSSSSDVISQEGINNLLYDLKGSKTLISIAHRLQVLKYCDRIIFMDEGKIVDTGTFGQLCAKYDTFKRMVELSNFDIN